MDRAAATVTEPAEITEDRLMGGRVVLRQPRKGYRAGLDAALLAAAVELKPGERMLDAGCGPGAALLQAAMRAMEARLTGLERDPAAGALGRDNIGLNDLDGRVEILPGDVSEGFPALGLPPFDAAMANPPFFDDPGAIRGPHPARTGAWIADDGLDAWLRFLLQSVRDGGRITVIHRADRLGDLLAGLDAQAGSFRIRPVQPFADTPAKRVLVRAVKRGRAPLVLLPALVLHDRSAGAKHTPEVDAILRGEAALTWD
jgi:tRNA1(Val) A37 N6-methylase TrmN6